VGIRLCATSHSVIWHRCFLRKDLIFNLKVVAMLRQLLHERHLISRTNFCPGFLTRIEGFCLFVFGATAPQWGKGLLIPEVSRSRMTHHSRQDSSGRVISSSQRPLPVNTQHSQQTDIHASGGIGTHNLSKLAAADPRLRRRGHWDRLVFLTAAVFCVRHKLNAYAECRPV